MSASEYLSAHHAVQADACRSLRANANSADLRAAYTREAAAHEALSMAYADLAQAEDITSSAERADRLQRQISEQEHRDAMQAGRTPAT